MDYLKKKNDLKKQKEVFDEKQKASYALFGFPWAFMIWIYEAFPHLGEFAGKSMDEPLPIPRILRWHTSKNDKIIEGDPFKYKGKVTENVHPYIIPTVQYVLNGLKKELEGVTVLTLNEDSDDEGDLGGNSVGVRVGDDDSPSTSKDAAGTSFPGDLHKRVAALEEVVLDIATYIKEKRIKKKENDERQHERVHVHESKRNEEGEKKRKMDELATVVAEQEKGEEKKDGEEDKSQEEGEKVVAAAEEEEAAADEQGGAEKGKTVEEEADKADKKEVEKEAAGEQKEEAEEETAAETEEKTAAAGGVRKESVEEKETEEAAADAHAEKEGEEDGMKKQLQMLRKKKLKLSKQMWSWTLLMKSTVTLVFMRNLGKETFRC
ncbi:hypothetical protein P3L10_029085 [Capsicum annuum]